MYVVMGATGQVGGTVVDSLVSLDRAVRAIGRDRARIAGRHGTRAQPFTADTADAAALTKAFTGADGIFVMDPPNYTSSDLFADSARNVSAIHQALRDSNWPRTVLLSSVGAHLPNRLGNIATVSHMETALAHHPRLTVVRAAWFMENWSGGLATAKQTGRLPSFLSPIDRKLPMVSAVDIGQTSAEVLLKQRDCGGTIELQGPAEYAPLDVAAAAARVLGQSIAVDPVPLKAWPGVLQGLGFAPRAIEGWVEMLDGFNSGRISFEGGDGVEVRRGSVTLDGAVKRMLGHG